MRVTSIIDDSVVYFVMVVCLACSRLSACRERRKGTGERNETRGTLAYPPTHREPGTGWVYCVIWILYPPSLRQWLSVEIYCQKSSISWLDRVQRFSVNLFKTGTLFYKQDILSRNFWTNFVERPRIQNLPNADLSSPQPGENGKYPKWSSASFENFEIDLEGLLLLEQMIIST